MASRLGRLALCALGAMAIPAWALAAPGDLDPRFGNGGTVITDLGGADAATAVALQADGKLVVVGRSTNASNNTSFALARYDARGSLDPTFGSGGVVVSDFGSNDQAFAVAVQPDEKIVVAGRRGSDVIVARYEPGGAPDLTFGEGGRTLTSFGATELALAMVLQPDGKIMIGGRTSMGGTFNFALARYQPTGALDPTFGQQGLVSTDFGGTGDRVFAMALQPDGKAIVAGDSDANVALARYNADGSLDPAFGNGGLVLTTLGGIDQASAVVLQPDGKILVAGRTDVSSNVDFALVRYNADGSPDATFGQGGRVITNFAGGTDIASAVALQFDGKIVVGGTSGGNLAVARYGPDGNLDISFGAEGRVTTDLGETAQISALVIQPDGRILAVGEASDHFALARYEAFNPVSLELRPNRNEFQPGDTAQFDVALNNSGPPIPVDVYLGAALPEAAGPGFGCPGGDAAVFFGPDLVPVTTCLSALPAGATPLARNATLPGATGSRLLSNFFSMVWPAGAPSGPYEFFLALAPAGTREPMIVAPASVSLSIP